VAEQVEELQVVVVEVREVIVHHFQGAQKFHLILDLTQ
jgi:hypothetical protein